MDLTIITCGGTYLQAYDRVTGEMQQVVRPIDLLKDLPGSLYPVAHSDLLPVRTGAELTLDIILQIQQIVLDEWNHSSGFVLMTGTDTLDECAFALAILLNARLLAFSKSLVVSGAMRPSDQQGYDGLANLVDAAKVARSVQASQSGVLVVMNDAIHLADYVHKADSQLLGAFRSQHGPMGHMRGGRPKFYYGRPMLDAEEPWWLPVHAAPHQLAPHMTVAIWTLGVSGFVPEELLQVLDGLVLAAPGTGSLPHAIIEQLAPTWTRAMPIVITSRCTSGMNYDDHNYKGSLAKYRGRGFILDGETADMTPQQARLWLLLKFEHGWNRDLVTANALKT